MGREINKVRNGHSGPNISPITGSTNTFKISFQNDALKNKFSLYQTFYPNISIYLIKSIIQIIKSIIQTLNLIYYIIQVFLIPYMEYYQSKSGLCTNAWKLCLYFWTRKYSTDMHGGTARSARGAACAAVTG